MANKRCKDCVTEGVSSKRKAPHPGPRCATHWREVKRLRAESQHAKHIGNVYGLSGDEYRKLYEAQGGRCFICQRANGASKKLAVDHDHENMWVRGLLCGPCNRGVLGHLRDDVEAFKRAIDYLESPPALKVIGPRAIPFDDE